jgi:hypothetical protein
MQQQQQGTGGVPQPQPQRTRSAVPTLNRRAPVQPQQQQINPAYSELSTMHTATNRTLSRWGDGVYRLQPVSLPLEKAKLWEREGKLDPNSGIDQSAWAMGMDPSRLYINNSSAPPKQHSLEPVGIASSSHW